MTAIREILPYKNYLFSGEDALTFLQGQLTQDINIITQKTCHYGAFCDVKGRMLANFMLFGTADGYVLRLHEALAESVISRLKMFIMRSKVTVERLAFSPMGLNQEGAQIICQQIGEKLPAAFSSVYTEDFTLCALPNNYYELTVFSNSLLGSMNELSEINEDIDAIETLRLSGGHFNILPDTYESILPQQTTLEAWGAISYKKGCYVGQEIIARNKYRGKVTKGMGYALLNQSLELKALTTIRQDGKAVGQVIESHRNEDSTACLCVMSIDKLGEDVSVDDCNTIFRTIAVQ